MTTELIAKRQEVLGPSYRLFYDTAFHPVRGEGVWLYDAAGRAYLDAYNNVASVGHCQPDVVKALRDQALTLNTHTRYLHEHILTYADRLLQTLPGVLNKVTFTCTGSEANDLAIRVARAWTGGTGFVVTRNAYHGITAALAEMSPSLGTGIGAHVRTIPAPDPHSDDTGTEFAVSLQGAIDDLEAQGVKFAGLIADSIFASDGIFAEPAGFLKQAVSITRARGGVYIADEVQAGLGRLGTHMWGFSRHGIEPDMVTMGKPMGNGHPLAAVAMRDDLAQCFGTKARYFNTFGGNPVSMKVGLAVLDVFEREGLQKNARDVGHYLVETLRGVARDHSDIVELRGAGLYLGVELRDGELSHRVVNHMRNNGVLLSASGPDGAVLKIRPPLLFSRSNADQLAEGLDKALRDCGT